MEEPETSDLLKRWRVLEKTPVTGQGEIFEDDVTYLESALKQCVEIVFEETPKLNEVIASVEYLRDVLLNYSIVPCSLVNTEEFCDLVLALCLSQEISVKRAGLSLIASICRETFPPKLVNESIIRALITISDSDSSVLDLILRVFDKCDVHVWAGWFSEITRKCFEARFLPPLILSCTISMLSYDQERVYLEHDLILAVVNFAFEQKKSEDLLMILACLAENHYLEFEVTLRESKPWILSVLDGESISLKSKALRLVKSLLSESTSSIFSNDEMFALCQIMTSLWTSSNREIVKLSWEISYFLMTKTDGVARFFLEHDILHTCAALFLSDLHFDAKISAAMAALQAVLLDHSSLLTPEQREILESVYVELEPLSGVDTSNILREQMQILEQRFRDSIDCYS